MTKEELKLIKEFIEGLDHVSMCSSNTGEDYFVCFGCGADVYHKFDIENLSSTFEIRHDKDCLFIKVENLLEKYN